MLLSYVLTTRITRYKHIFIVLYNYVNLYEFVLLL